MKRNRHAVRLEMTPLMDVMFLVLVFFVYSIFEMSVHRGLKVDMPNAAGVDVRGEQIVVTIAADDSLQINGQPTTREGVLEKVRALYSANMKMPVLISGDRRATLGIGIELLSGLKAVGVEKARFQVRR